MLPFGVTIQAVVPQRLEITEGLMNYPVLSLAISGAQLFSYAAVSISW